MTDDHQVRVLVWILNVVYGPRDGMIFSAINLESIDDIIRRQYEDERKSQRLDSIV